MRIQCKRIIRDIYERLNEENIANAYQYTKCSKVLRKFIMERKSKYILDALVSVPSPNVSSKYEVHAHYHLRYDSIQINLCLF
jgi:predicted nucleotidyltransferase